MTRKSPLYEIEVELLRGKEIRPQIKEHLSELVHVTDVETYNDKKIIFNIIVFDNDTNDLKDGIYYIFDKYTSTLVLAAEIETVQHKLGREVTAADADKIVIPVVLIKLEIKNGKIFFGEGDDYKNKVEITNAMLMDHQIQ